jgi:AAA family ATP:ADP antiporter
VASTFETGIRRGSDTERKTPIDRLLGLAADVHAGEGLTALLLSFNGFLLLSSYYTIRSLRSALLLPVQLQLPGGGVITGPEIQSYVGSILAAAFLFIVPLYSSIASRTNRIRLINSVTMFFVVTLIGFFFATSSGVFPAMVAVTFFVWIGVFSLMIIAQFWSFANDLYTPEEGKRLFAIVGFGGSVGAIIGALIASSLIQPWGLPTMMLLGAAQLIGALALNNIIHKRDQLRRRATTSPSAAAAKAPDKPLGTSGGFKLVLGQRYLLLIGLLTLTINIVNTNGNYILNETLAQMARAVIGAGADGRSEREIIGSFMAGTDFWQNVLSMAIQFFLVSRIFKYLGIGGALFVMPLVSFTSYSLFAFAPVLSLIRIAKISENATDYSLQNTVRRALFLPTSREAKYKALQAVETFFWRAGDMVSSVMVLIVVRWLELSARGFAFVNIALIAIWLFLAWNLSRENRRLMAQSEPAAA